MSHQVLKKKTHVLSGVDLSRNHDDQLNIAKKQWQLPQIRRHSIGHEMPGAKQMSPVINSAQTNKLWTHIRATGLIDGMLLVAMLCFFISESALYKKNKNNHLRLDKAILLGNKNLNVTPWGCEFERPRKTITFIAGGTSAPRFKLSKLRWENWSPGSWNGICLSPKKMWALTTYLQGTRSHILWAPRLVYLSRWWFSFSNFGGICDRSLEGIPTCPA